VPQAGGGAEVECVDAVLGTAEVCDGVDNDCDGNVDGPGQMPGEGDDCTTDCGPGSLHCRGGELVCESDSGSREVCNGVDDDCDGDVDEETDLAEVGIACFADEDQTFPPCQPGRTECVADGDGGASIECVGATEGTDEVCDGLDNDCDGIIDNGTFDEAGEACLTEVLEELFGDLGPDEELPGECQRGTLACVQGSTDDGDVVGEIGCIGAVEPVEEICNGLDDDCDGEADSPEPCPGESQCIAGRCTERCTVMGEFVICPGGQVCSADGYCVPLEEAGSGGSTGGTGDAGATAGPEGAAGSSVQGTQGAAGSGPEQGSDAGGASSGPDSSGADTESGRPAWDSDGDGKRDDYALATGGGGCSCRIGHAPPSGLVALGMALMGLVVRLLRMRRRTGQGRRAA
jgi:hypothetical protein